MHFKVIFAAAILGVCTARPQEGHGHGHAYSSQSIVLHQSHSHEQQAHHAAPQHHDATYHHAAPQHHAVDSNKHEEHHEDYYAHPKYEFEYKIEDPHTHDFKSQHESRDGDVVKGHYSLHQPDGTVRIVHYTTDKHNGFNAEVKFEGHATHQVPSHHH